MPAGIEVDNEFIFHQLDLRKPKGNISTPRKEADEFIIESGVFNNKTTGTPICILIENTNTHSSDYSASYGKARPGHADFTAFSKYNGNEDYRGGGHFSGRVTAGIVAAGAIAISALNKKGIKIATHIKECAGVKDDEFSDYLSEYEALNAEMDSLNNKAFATISTEKAELMIKKIEEVGKTGDSVGGILETVVIGVPVGVGEPWFDSVESVISHAIFSVPAIKGVEFGSGFSSAAMLGSEMNDTFFKKDGKTFTLTNNNAGINGGITNGMPIVIKSAVKPTPSISKEQETIDFLSDENTLLSVKGRHDPCIVHRARVVIDSITAIALCDLLSQKFGTDWLGKI